MDFFFFFFAPNHLKTCFPTPHSFSQYFVLAGFFFKTLFVRFFCFRLCGLNKCENRWPQKTAGKKVIKLKLFGENKIHN